jgi:hypothetical protein
MFKRITDNNLSIDLTIENIVNAACIKDETHHRPDREQIEKTSRLLFLSGLILGEQDSDDGEENE